MSQPRVSVVIPLYNKRDTLPRCLESVLRQTFPDFEAVVVDDGSTDGSGGLARELPDPRIRVISQPNAGVAAARNRGIAESRATHVAFLDADDEWKPEFLAAIIGLIERYPQAGMYVTGLRHDPGDGSWAEMSFTLPGDGETGVTDEYFSAPEEASSISSGSSTAIRKEVVDQVGGFPTGELQGEDLDLWVRIAARYPVAFDRRILAVYHSGQQGQRELQRVRRKSAYCQPLSSLRKIVEAREVEGEKLDQIKRFRDCRAMENAYWQISLGLASARAFIEEERYYTPRYRFEAAMLRWGARVMPLEWLYALRWKPAGAAKRLRRLVLGTPEIVTGRMVTWRLGRSDSGSHHGA